MHISLFGVAITTKLYFEPSSWLLWATQVVIATFFMSGVLGHYQNVYDVGTDKTVPPQRRYAARALLLLLSVGLGIILHMMGYLVGINSMMFHNLSLFLITFPLLDRGISQFEVALRAVTLIGLWSEYNVGMMHEPRYALSLVLLGVWIFLARWGHANRNKQSIGSVSLLVASTGVGYWLLMPAFSASMYRDEIVVRGILMYAAMTAIAAYLWDRRARAHAHNVEMARLAQFDQLTNAGTYAQYQDNLTDAFTRAKASGQSLTMAAIDIDHFKQINDYYGHLAGNTVLIGVATTLDDVLGRTDVDCQLYRTGGEEFSIVFTGVTPKEALPIVEDCWSAVRKGHYRYQDHDIAVSLSVGVTELADSDLVVDDVIKRADDNLYLSKHAGRDTITVEGETLHDTDNRDLVATYAYFTQPIVSSEGNGRYRNELLLRMFDNERDRWVLPDMFDISVGTQVDLMRRALAQSSTRRISINLTTAQFSDTHVANEIVAFATSKEGPDELTIEITDVPELRVMRDITAIYRTGHVRVTIDDVGSDNSYEVVNKLLPYVDGVKFAMQNLRRTKSAELMEERVAFWADVAQKNDLAFVLEGVESKDEYEHFRDTYGITLFQGYYFSKPVLPRL